jgi:ATP-dependent RNA helicase DDX19/DBP5
MPQALCLAPSRELARQIEGVVRSIGQFVDGLTIQAAVPGAVERNAKVAGMVVVGTPGTVMDLIKRRQFDTSQMKVLCLDEADNMLDQQGLGDQCMRVKQFVSIMLLRKIKLTDLQDASQHSTDSALLCDIPG